ncbi:sigma-54-dependent Fis family transcriptional regulator [candidate division KSB1 bacterium]|nr:MAG: sigma-54-dependent Fis family transcriptional regulator [candidate division KSB1 bacterium]
MGKARILVVDDEFHIRDWVAETLRRRNYLVETCEDGHTALEMLAKDEPFDIVITDLRMPKMSGLTLLKTIRERYANMDVLMMTAYGTIADAVTAIKDGAHDFLEKPFPQETLLIRIQKILENRKLRQENYALKRELGAKSQFDAIIGASQIMMDLYEQLQMIAPSKATVLVTGDSGTGKELVAREIHMNSPRRNGPFIKVNCAAMPETLMESELFGHEKGAFTGAIKTVEGRFALANGGTLLLDEISEMGMGMQAKLLRVLQEREFEKLGGRETIKIDIRIVATSNRDLKKEIKEKRFREDLFHRLNVCPIHLPMLAERPDDIPLLATHFLNRYAGEYGKELRGIQDRALEMLMQYSWPGNVRELQHKMERAVIMCNEPLVGPKHLFLDDLDSRPAAAAIQLSDGSAITLKEIEKSAIFRALQFNENNRTKTAEALGISIRTLRNKLREYREEGVNVG